MPAARLLPDMVREASAAGDTPEVIARRHRLSVLHVRMLLDEFAREAAKPARMRAGPRTCLRCNIVFPSTHAGNRLCENCAKYALSNYGYDPDHHRIAGVRVRAVA